MGLGIETVVGSYAATATTGAQAYTPGNGQSFQVRATNGTTVAHLAGVWTKSTDAGYTQIKSPRLHDDVIGIQAEHYIGNTSPLLDENFDQTLYSQDTLTVQDYFTTAPTANDVQQVAMQIYYDDLPGVAGNYMTWAQVAPMIQSYMGVYVAPASNATVGQWGVGVALNSSQDVFKANSWYALIGYTTPTLFTAWSILGSDLGNLQVGGPGSVDPKITRNWFPYLEQVNGMASIPVINSQNKQSTLIQVFHSAASVTLPIGLIFAYLGTTSGT
jgi:hypothetical protein